MATGDDSDVRRRVVRALANAADTLEPGGTWCRGAVARTIRGLPCAALSPRACRWSAWGAVVLGIGEDRPAGAVYQGALEALELTLPPVRLWNWNRQTLELEPHAARASLLAWNDEPGRTVGQVRALYWRAVARLDPRARLRPKIGA